MAANGQARSLNPELLSFIIMLLIKEKSLILQIISNREKHKLHNLKNIYHINNIKDLKLIRKLGTRNLREIKMTK
jgi:hypothetical protein